MAKVKLRMQGGAAVGDTFGEFALPQGAHWPVVGRDREYADAMHLLTGGTGDGTRDGAATGAVGGPRGVLLVGAPGVGKSTLAARIQHALAETTHVLTLTPSADVAPFMLGGLAPLLGGLEPDDVARPWAMLRALTDRVGVEAGGRPVVIRVEDAHLLDATSAALLRHLACSGAARLIMTSRPAPAMLDEFVAMWKDGELDRIDVPPFTRAEVGSVLQRALRGVVAWTTERRLWETTGGNALYLRELVRSALASGELSPTRGVWIWHDAGLPAARLSELVASELRAVPAGRREILEIVALAGAVSVDVALAVADEAVVDELTEAHLLAIDDAGPGVPTLRVGHPVYAEVIRTMVPPGRRRSLRRALAVHLPAPDGRSLPGLMRWVSWALETGEVPEPGRLVEAAALANRLHQHAEAVRFVDVALTTGAEPGVLAAAYTERAEAFAVLGDPQRAHADLDRIETLGREPADSRRRARAAITRADLHFPLGDDPARALTVLGDAQAHVDEGQDADLLEGRRLAVELYSDPSGSRLDDAWRFLHTDTVDPATRASLSGAVQIALGQRGRITEAEALAHRLLATARDPRSGAESHIPGIRAAHFLVLLWAGRVAEAVDFLADETDLDLPSVAYYSDMPQVGRALTAMAAGCWSEATEKFRAAEMALLADDLPGLLAYTLARAAECAVYAGNHAEAVRLRAASSATPRRISRALEGDLRRALVAVGIAGGEDGAAAAALDLAEWAAERGLVMTEFDAAHLALVATSDAGDRSRLAHRIGVLAGRCSGMPRAEAIRAHADAVVSGDPDTLGAATTALADLGMWTQLPLRHDARLTRREREIAALAAARLSSREIAGRLTISPRTVDSHLARVYGKLGVTGRSGLAATLRRE